MQIDGYNNNNNAYNPITVEEHFRQQYFESLDLVVSSIKERFNQPVFIAFLKMEQMLLNMIQKKDYTAELKHVLKVYGTDVDPIAFDTEVFSFSVMFKTTPVQSFDEILRHLTSLPSSQWGMIPNIMTIVKLILINPST
jgi:hypothetical protein